MWKPRSVGWPVTLAVVMIPLLVAVTVGWILAFTRIALTEPRHSVVYWSLLAVGTAFLVLVLVGVVLYLLISIKEIRLNQRQSNFIDSVTHELKSPITSLKLYLQTLARRNTTEEQRADFHGFMLEDVERLDSLINHLLDAARLDQQPVDGEAVDVELGEVLKRCAVTACRRHRMPEDIVTLRIEPAIVRARPMDVDMVFRNLLDNAVKYSGDHPTVEIESRCLRQDKVVTRIIDNGQGIPRPFRRKIFGRFVRAGSELERSKPGTGLGLYIVATLVRRMRGAVYVRGRSNTNGTIFEVELPGRPVGDDEVE